MIVVGINPDALKITNGKKDVFREPLTSVSQLTKQTRFSVDIIQLIDILCFMVLRWFGLFYD